MKVLISGGGTAGHINPAIAIGTYLAKQGADVIYVGSHGALEEKLYSKTGCPFYQFTSKGLDRKHLFKNFKILSTDYQAYRQIQALVNEFQPDVGVSTGGYISAMSMYALKQKNIPFLIHEQNAYPGLTTKLLSRWAKSYAVAFREAVSYLKYPDRAVLTGNPIRSEFVLTDRSMARQKLGIPEDSKVVLCFGGSLGAKKLNEAVAGIIPMAQKDGITLFIGTGSRYYDSFIKENQSKVTDHNLVRIQKYIDDMPTALAACDLAVTRAGAMTISELCAVLKPAILIPSPNVTANHQEKNAQAMVNCGGAFKISETELTSKNLYNSMKSLLSDEDRLLTMQTHLKPLSITDGDRRIAELVQQIAHTK
ncbi:MAG: undecaprenyldiphospho-muramoylpentapeptide beta-N-acetylglucosaminyltransferase [Clostridia bacterium]|nr:undecaprenyldiphospho-muramoylpentapeptide beta-N-acetylglucosaminyltransferase [Clostridia bacterium]